MLVPASFVHLFVSRSLMKTSSQKHWYTLYLKHFNKSVSDDNLLKCVTAAVGATPENIAATSVFRDTDVGHAFLTLDHIFDPEHCQRELRHLEEFTHVTVKHPELPADMKWKNIPFSHQNRLRRVALALFFTFVILVVSGVLSAAYVAQIYLSSPVTIYATSSLGSLYRLLQLAPTIAVVLISRGVVALIAITNGYERHTTRSAAKLALFRKYSAALFLCNIGIPAVVFGAFAVILSTNSFPSIFGRSDFPNLFPDDPVSTFSIIAGEYCFSLLTSIAIIGPSVDLIRLPALFAMLRSKFMRGQLPKKFAVVATAAHAALSESDGEMQLILPPKTASAGKFAFPFALRYAQSSVVFTTGCVLGCIFPLVQLFLPVVLSALLIYDRYVLAVLASKPIVHTRSLQAAALSFVLMVTNLVFAIFIVGFAVLWGRVKWPLGIYDYGIFAALFVVLVLMTVMSVVSLRRARRDVRQDQDLMPKAVAYTAGTLHRLTIQ
eukprot:TRINITY_DN2666_c0_g1_i1.p2 TRINITY_DN2666_c0_g1~~TRINITY_DN2666_c0_g1_i1.p2  ORF type:complete len:493 (-),score=82.76 TRINITY_DN2666_c0_g1_i1:202-1680(-)